jgi:hypothetical protein
MPRSIGAILVLIRIAVVWLSIYGAGSVIRSILVRLGLNRGLPFNTLLTGFCTILIILPLLSPAGVMTRSVVSAIVFLFAAFTCIRTLPLLKGFRPTIGRDWPVFLPFALFVLFLCISNFARAVRPNDNPDALITYAVQPDRWLDAGRIYFLEETEFSAMPLVGEIVAVPVASLSSGRLDQLSLLQAFQMSLLLASLVLVAWRLGGGKWGVAAALCAGASCPMLAGWGALAKVDMTAAFFLSIAMVEAASSAREGRAAPAASWLAFGLAAATKLTVWAMLPAFLIVAVPGWLKQRPRSPAQPMLCLAALILVPAVFAVRTWIHTGTPFYPFSITGLHANAGWAPTPVPALDSLGAGDPASLPHEIMALIGAWGATLFVFLIGLVALISGRRIREAILPVASVLVTAALSFLAFRPLAWGAKYSLHVLPFIAGLGGVWIARSRINLYAQALLVVLVCLMTPIVARARFLMGFGLSAEPLQFDTDTYDSPREAQLWMNINLPSASRVLSLFSAERYFSDFEVICARTHPVARSLFVVEGLDQELAVLRRLGITHMYFDIDDPMQMDLTSTYFFEAPDSLPDLAGHLSIIADPDAAELLDTLAIIDGYAVCSIEF